jgi:hypothetical protein
MYVAAAKSTMTLTPGVKAENVPRNSGWELKSKRPVIEITQAPWSLWLAVTDICLILGKF